MTTDQLLRLLDSLKFLSQTHRGIHSQRLKIEYRVLFTTLTFFVAIAALYGKGELHPPASPYFGWVAWGVPLGFAVLGSTVLWKFHDKNRQNKAMAEAAEAEIAALCPQLLVKVAEAEIELRTPEETIERKTWENWAWRWQTIVLILTALLCSAVIACLGVTLQSGILRSKSWRNWEIRKHSQF